MKAAFDSYAVAALPPEAAISAFAADCIDGLSRAQKSLSCKWLYDDLGSQLFERITTVPEYYPTRVEEALIEAAVPQIADRLEPPTALVELGSGASRKTRLVLAACDAVTRYIPIDISADELRRAHVALRADFPHLSINPLCADFSDPSALGFDQLTDPVLLFFPGSTLGNMAPAEAVRFLQSLRRASRPGTRLLLGVDLMKDEQTLCAAYDDAAGVTAAFNLNLLERMRRELGAVIDVESFRHRAVWNGLEQRIEMHLVAQSEQEIALLGRRFTLEAGETIHTENSYKLSMSGWRDVFGAAGWQMEADWQSGEPRFLLALLSAGNSASA